MPIADTNDVTPRKPLRVWPGVVIVTLTWLAIFLSPILAPGDIGYSVLSGIAGGFALFLWWLLFSRAPWSDRLGTLVLIVISVVAAKSIVHASIENGMMGRMLFVLSPPVVGLALVCAAVVTRRLSSGPRRASIAAAILLACGAFTVVRSGGIRGGGPDLHWRWTPTPEQRLLAQAGDEPAVRPSTQIAVAAPAPLDAARGGPGNPLPPAASPEPFDARRGRPGATPSASPAGTALETPPLPAAAEPPAIWPGFRGPDRDDVVRGVRIKTDWTASPPIELWRRPIGPGWSSFAVRGTVLYTQEQRGDYELVACYDAATGKPVWMHRDKVRFWESNGGAGPRATPALSGGRVYTFGATGILNALDARTGAVVWSRNPSSDTKVKLPGWGFTSSPLVVDNVVVVAVSGALAAYDLATGDPRWSRKSGGGSYSSPHLVTIDGTTQILLMGGGGITSVAPGTGTMLWEQKWEGSPMVQPAQVEGGDLLITTADAMGGLGVRRVAVARGPGGWTVDQRWESRSLKPYFSDFVVHNGYAFGFDGSILACIDLADGTRKWKGGRYGNGQLVLLAEQDVLLVISEEGELALVKATPDQFTEVARFKALEGKTWNHPVVAGDVLLVRNGEEMAAFRLSLEGR